MRGLGRRYFLAGLCVCVLFALPCRADEAALLEKLVSGVAADRIEAAISMAELPEVSAAATPALIRGLSDAYLEVRRHSALALAKVGDPALPALREALASDGYYAQIYAARAIGAMGERRADTATARLLVRNVAPDCVDQERQAAAAWALGEMMPDDSSLLPELQAAYKGARSANVRQYLSKVMSGLEGGEAMIPELVKQVGHDDSAAAALVKFGTASVKPLLRELGTQDKRRAWAIFEILARIGPDAKEAVPAFVQELQKPRDQWFGELVARCLGDIGPAAAVAVDPLCRVLEEGSYVPARVSAAQSLGRIGVYNETVGASLKKAAADENADVAAAAKSAIKELTE